MNCSIILGQRAFSASVSDLTLSLQASASMLLSPESSVLCDSKRLKEDLCSGNIWVSQTHELKVNIHIAFGPDLHPSFAPFVSQLGDSTCKEKMWTDLGLAVLYKSCIYEPEQTYSTYILSFGIQKRLEPSEKTNKPKVPKILRDTCDAIPPTDIPTARITSVDVFLKYSHNYKRSIARFPQQESHDGSQDITQSTVFDNWNWEGVHHSPENIPGIAEANDPTLEDDCEMNEGWEPFNHSNSESFSFLEFGALFQKALTTLVLGGSARGRNNHQTGSDGFLSLSRIAPSVFKPGYREAMNQRSRFMPSIAKSLASMLKLSDNQALKDRIASVKAKHNSNEDVSTQLSNEDDTKAILKTRLWTIAQKRLYHARTPKNLRPSSYFLNPDQDKHTQDEEIISETITEGTVYFDDDCDSINHETNIYQDIDEPELNLDLEATGESNSSMILGDNHTEHSAEMSEEHHYHSDRPKPSSPSTPIEEECYPTPLYTRTISLSNSEYAETDQEMLDFDSNTAEEIQALSSQTSISHSPHSYVGRLINLREDEDEMLCDDLWE